MSTEGGTLNAGASVHVPVMGREVKEYLRLDQGGEFLDCTFGGGGHTALMLEAHSESKVLAVDRDQRALDRGASRFSYYLSGGVEPGAQARLRLQHGSFVDVSRLCADMRFDGMLADLGLSSDQLAEGRGFSFADNRPLDMRMDEGQSLTADEVVNTYSERDLIVALKRGGVGSTARTMVRAMIRSRPISSAKALADVLLSVTPKRFLVPGFHPATVVFQAIRIEVNQELAQIEALLEQAPDLLRDRGRFAVITFHSGEDKLVTQRMRRWETGESRPAMWRGSHIPERRGKGKGTRGGDSGGSFSGSSSPRRSDRVQRGEPVGKFITRSAVVPSEEEVAINSRARSARLRVFEFDQIVP